MTNSHVAKLNIIQLGHLAGTRTIIVIVGCGTLRGGFTFYFHKK